MDNGIGAPPVGGAGPVLDGAGAQSPSVAEVDAATVMPAYKPGGFWRRVLASILDGFIISTLMLPFVMLIPFAGLPATSLFRPGALWAFLTQLGVFFGSVFVGVLTIRFFYFGWFYRNKGASPGKMVFQLKVLNSETGLYLGYGQTFVRECIAKPFVCTLLTLNFGYLVVGLRADKRGLHDLLCASWVAQVG